MGSLVHHFVVVCFFHQVRTVSQGFLGTSVWRNKVKINQSINQSTTPSLVRFARFLRILFVLGLFVFVSEAGKAQTSRTFIKSNCGTKLQIAFRPMTNAKVIYWQKRFVTVLATTELTSGQQKIILAASDLITPDFVDSTRNEGFWSTAYGTRLVALQEKIKESFSREAARDIFTLAGSTTEDSPLAGCPCNI